MKIGILGGQGYVGEALVQSLEKQLDYEVISISRNDYLLEQYRDHFFDILIHAANPAKRLIANQNPKNDYLETVQKTQDVISKFRYSQLILISTLSCRTQVNSVYGRNRKDCENLVNSSGGKIIRFGPMYGGRPRLTTLDQILRGEFVFFSSDTRYSYSSVEWNAQYVTQHLENLNNFLEIGARNSISLAEIADALESNSEFGDVNDDQVIENFQTGPDSFDIIRFARGVPSDG